MLAAHGKGSGARPDHAGASREGGEAGVEERVRDHLHGAGARLDNLQGGAQGCASESEVPRRMPRP